MQYLKKSLLYFLISIIVLANFAAFLLSEKVQAAETRPQNCRTFQTPQVTKTPEETPPYYSCATTSPAGYTLHLWYGNATGPTGDEEFVYVGQSDFRNLGLGNIGEYTYRSTKETDFYIAVTSGLTRTHYFRAGKDGNWNAYAYEYDRKFKIVNGKLPEYKRAFEDADPTKRFVWRIVANGKVFLDNTPVLKGEGYSLALLDREDGPALDKTYTGKSGPDPAVFEFSYQNTNADIWINQGTVKKLYFYVGLTKDGKKYETKPLISVSIPSGWKLHGDDDTKLINLGDIKFTSADKVENFSRSDQGEKSFIEETLGSDEGMCGLNVGDALKSPFRSILAIALCEILKWMGELAKAMINGLFYNVFNAYHGPSQYIKHLAEAVSPFSIGQVHAEAADEDLSKLVNALDSKATQWPWVIPAWKLVLGLTDMFLVIILLFLGIVNILHIQYDTYQIKKMLPLLIISTILANFSLLIMRMLLVAANILTNSFIPDGKTPGDLVRQLITNVNVGEATGFWSGQVQVWGLVLAVLFSFFAIVAFLILGVMFYARYAIVIVLAIAAPLAFICLAFPPTQSLFKQWWSWATKMVFMKPIAFFLIFLAAQIKGGEGATNSIVAWMIIIALVYMAIIVPWKLGGAVMSMWGGAMGSIFGTKKGGYMRKPVDDWWQRRKDMAGAKLKRMPGISWLASRGVRDKDLTEAAKKETEGRLKQRMRGDNKYVQAMARAENAENKAKQLEALQKLGVNSGSYNDNFGLKPIKGKRGLKIATELKKDIHDTQSTLQRALKGISKDADWALFNVLGKDMQDANELNARFKSKELNVLTEYDLNEDGTLNETGESTHYGKLKQLRDQLNMRFDTEEDEEKKQNLLKSMKQIDSITNGFERAHPELPFNAYLNRNLTGRQLALLAPLLLDEAKTNEQSMSVQEFKNSLFGNKGGGYGDVRYKDNDTISDILKQRYGVRTHLEKSGGLAVLLGAINRAVGNGVDAQEMLEMVLTGVDKGFTTFTDEDGPYNFEQKAYLPGYWQKELEAIDKTRPGSVKAALKEYNRDAQNRGDKFLDAKLIDRMSDAEAREHTPVEIIGAINTSDPNAKHQRFLYNQVRSRTNNSIAFVRDRNPATRIGDVSMPEETAQAGQAGQGPGPVPGPSPTGPNPFQNSQDVQNLTERLSSASPEELPQIYQQYGGASKLVEKLLQGESAVDIASCLDDMRAGLAQKLIPLSATVKLSTESFDKLIDHLSNLEINVGLNHDQLQEELHNISPDINVDLDRDMPVESYITEAKKVKQGTQNAHELLIESEVEDIEPYTNHMLRKDESSLNEYLSNIDSSIARLASAAEQAETRIAAGEKNVTIDSEAIRRGVEAAQAAKGGDLPLNVANYSGNNAVELNQMLIMLRRSIIGALNYQRDASLQSIPDGLKIALRNAVREGTSEAQAQSTTPTSGEQNPPRPSSDQQAPSSGASIPNP